MKEWFSDETYDQGSIFHKKSKRAHFISRRESGYNMRIGLRLAGHLL
jgi:hypothetical protein